jgi:hypothetical protein
VFDLDHLEPTPLPPQFDHAPMLMVPCPIVERHVSYTVVEKVLYYVHSSSDEDLDLIEECPSPGDKLLHTDNKSHPLLCSPFSGLLMM